MEYGDSKRNWKMSPCPRCGKPVVLYRFQIGSFDSWWMVYCVDNQGPSPVCKYKARRGMTQKQARQYHEEVAKLKEEK